MSARINWYAQASSKGIEIVRYIGALERHCDALRFAVVGPNLGVNSTFHGKLLTKFSYYRADNAQLTTIYGFSDVTLGDTTMPSVFTIQGELQFPAPVRIKANTQIMIFVSHPPLTDSSDSNRTITAQWDEFAFSLRGNQI